MADFTRQDEHKPVRIGDQTVGTVVIGDDDTAYVAPSENAPDRLLAKLDWGTATTNSTRSTRPTSTR